MNEFIENLKRFNRKERYHLLCNLTQDAFHLCPDFRRKLEKKLNIEIPDRAYCTLDYHLDWLTAAVDLSQKTEKKQSSELTVDRRITGTQEDIDFLIAFETDSNERSQVHIVFVEAKNDTAWSSDQFKSKIERLGAIFKSDRVLIRNFEIIPHFLIVSPSEPTKKLTSGLKESAVPVASWLMINNKPLWIKLNLDRDSYLRVSTDKKNNTWKIVPDKELTVSFADSKEADPLDSGKHE